MAAPTRPLSTIADLAALGEDSRFELIDGEIVEKAAPTLEHSLSQIKSGGFIDRRFGRRPGGRWPGGWWFGTETHVQYASRRVCCHDVVGWRRDRVVERPTGWPVTVRPDWVCEILSRSHEKRDFVDKMHILHAAEVPHYWILDPEGKILIVHRYSAAGYVVVLTAGADATVRAEPFEQVETPVAVLLGDAEDEE